MADEEIPFVHRAPSSARGGRANYNAFSQQQTSRFRQAANHPLDNMSSRAPSSHQHGTQHGRKRPHRPQKLVKRKINAEARAAEAVAKADTFLNAAYGKAGGATKGEGAGAGEHGKTTLASSKVSLAKPYGSSTAPAAKSAKTTFGGPLTSSSMGRDGEAGDFGAGAKGYEEEDDDDDEYESDDEQLFVGGHKKSKMLLEMVEESEEEAATPSEKQTTQTAGAAATGGRDAEVEAEEDDDDDDWRGRGLFFRD